jgi:hypothetical protein
MNLELLPLGDVAVAQLIECAQLAETNGSRRERRQIPFLYQMRFGCRSDKARL